MKKRLDWNSIARSDQSRAAVLFKIELVRGLLAHLQRALLSDPIVSDSLFNGRTLKMPRCAGCTGTCYCALEAGPNIVISGNGNDVPYNISAVPDGAAGGWLGYTPHTADYVLTGSYTDVPGFTVTVTTVAGRRYKITAHGHTQISSVGDYGLHVRLVEGATVLSKDFQQNGAFTTVGQAFHLEAVVTPSAASHTYKVQGFADPSTAGNQVIADSTVGPGFLLVEDIGSV